ncbi:DUF3955 domain-containing protein [Secundilactobacillus odoratitofui]|nr:DUF3955 domain-containing protein [Secundilactobacillus odoratitofui]
MQIQFKKMLLGGLLGLAIGIVCYTILWFSPATLDAQGFVQQPFYLVIIGDLAIFLGLVLILIRWVMMIIRRVKK